MKTTKQKRKQHRKRNTDARDLFCQFEILLATSLLQTDKYNTQALMMLGNNLTLTGQHAKALEIDRRLTHLLPKEPIAYYNLACSYSHVGDISSALEAIAQAIGLGYDDVEFLLKDPDLHNVRNDSGFQNLVNLIINKG